MSDDLTSPLGSLVYDPAPESPSIAHLHPSYGLFLDGKFTEPEGHASFETLNPATRAPLARVGSSVLR